MSHEQRSPRETAGALERLLDVQSWHAVEGSKILRGPHVNRTVAVSYLDEARADLAALRSSADRAEKMEKLVEAVGELGCSHRDIADGSICQYDEPDQSTWCLCCRARALMLDVSAAKAASEVKHG